MLVTNKVNRGNLYKKEIVYEEETKINKSAIKQDNKDNLVVTVNGVTYEGDTVSMNYMSSVSAIANFKFNALLAQGIAPSDAYTAIYKSTIGWKGADDVVHQVQIESVIEALGIAMGEVANIIGA
jgi:hypothetical protein